MELRWTKVMVMSVKKTVTQMVYMCQTIMGIK